MLINLYGAIVSAIYVLGFPYLKRRYATGFDERRGIYRADKVKKGCIWVHAVSVGEVQAIAPFVSRLRDLIPSDVPVLLSTTTVTGMKMAENLGVKYDLHIYFPWDTGAIVGRALETFEPCVFIAAESEIWPRFITELKRRNIPSFLVNGRISDRSFKRMKRLYSFCGRFIGELLSSFKAIMVKEKIDYERLIDLGVDACKMIITGDCKIDAMIERKISVMSEKSPLLSSVRGFSAPVFLAGSTHPGEDEHVVEAFSIVRRSVPRARLIIVPRHPERAHDVLSLCGGNSVLYSRMEKNAGREWDIIVVDKIGVLFGLYSVAAAAFIGGSLVSKGGQNLMEPALFGVPVCHGPFMDDFRAVADEFDELGISTKINSAAQMADFWLKSVNEPSSVREKSERWFDERGGAAKKSAETVAEFLELRKDA